MLTPNSNLFLSKKQTTRRLYCNFIPCRVFKEKMEKKKELFILVEKCVLQENIQKYFIYF